MAVPYQEPWYPLQILRAIIRYAFDAEGWDASTAQIRKHLAAAPGEDVKLGPPARFNPEVALIRHELKNRRNRTSKSKPKETAMEKPVIATATAIENALNALGVDAGTQEVKDWIAQNYNGVDSKSASFSSALSAKRRTMKDKAKNKKAKAAALAAAKAAPAAAQVLPAPAAVPAVADLPSAMLEVSKVADNLKEVKELAAKVGGPQVLRMYLQMLD